MRIIRLSAVVLLLSCVLSAESKPKNSGKLGHLSIRLVAVTTPETTSHPSDSRMTGPRDGHHFFVIRVSIRNIGKLALCAELIPRLKAEFGLEYRDFFRRTDEPAISQLLPGEEVEGNYTFTVKDGVRPLELSLEAREYREGCRSSHESGGWVLVTGERVRFVLRELLPPASWEN